MFDRMDWSQATGDELDLGFDHFGGLTAAAQARVCELIGEVDRRQAWMRDGARSLVDWVGVRLGVGFGTAGRLVRVALRLTLLPVISESFRAGKLSLDQVDVLSQIATPTTEAGLVAETLGLSNAQLERLARRANPPKADDERSVYERRSLVRQWNLDVSELRFHGSLSAVEGAVFDRVIDERVERMGPNPETGMFDPLITRSADALIEVCSATTGDTKTTSSSLFQITVHADVEALTTVDQGVTELVSGGLVPNDVARYLSCDCLVETLVTTGSQVVGVGRNSRTVPQWLRRLVVFRDGGRCRFPGCRNPRWLHAHHIQHWADGGSTDLDNLILLCGFHHRFIHTHHWHITTGVTGGFAFRKPDWTLYPLPKPGLHPRLEQLAESGRPT
jgi:hypothetical protein